MIEHFVSIEVKSVFIIEVDSREEAKEKIKDEKKKVDIIMVKK